MKKINTLVIGLTALALTACGAPSNSQNGGNEQDDYKIKVIAPKGAPSLAFYDMANDDDFVTSDGEHIKSEFGQTNYGMIVMEFYTGLRTVKKSNSNYRLARVLTGGNLYLVSRKGKTTPPTKDDKVLAFGPGGKQGIPYLSLRKLYPEVQEKNITVLADGAAVQSALISGTFEGKNGDATETIDVDYVVIPQPALAGALSKLQSNDKVKPAIVDCLRDKVSEDTNGEHKWLLQAGLFIHEDLYNAHKEVFETKLDEIDANISTIIDSPEKVKTAIEDQLPNEADQKLKFSCPTKMIPAISKNPKTPNGFGFIDKDEWEKVNPLEFLTYLGISGEENNFSSYLLNRK